MLHVLGKIHEPGCHLVEQQLLFRAVKRPRQCDQSVDLVYCHEGRIPRGADQAIERPPDKKSGSRG